MHCKLNSHRLPVSHQHVQLQMHLRWEDEAGVLFVYYRPMLNVACRVLVCVLLPVRLLHLQQEVRLSPAALLMQCL